MSEVSKTRLERDLAEAEEKYLKDIEKVKIEYANNPFKLEIHLNAHKDAHERLKETIIAMDKKLQTTVDASKKFIDDSAKNHPLVANQKLTDAIKTAIDRIANK